MRRLFLTLTLIGLLVLSACGSPAASEPTQPSAAQPTSVPATAVAAAPPTPTFEAVTDEPIDLEPTTSVVQPSGTLAWRDQVLRNDMVAIQVSDLPAAAAGQVYAAWLANAEGSLPIGTLGATGGLSYVSATQENLLALYDRVYVGQVSADAAAGAVANVVLSGAVPPQALLHIRHGLAAFPETPDKLGFGLGLRQESDELLRHAQFLNDAFVQNDLALVKVHAEHMINIISGAESRDVNGDGKTQNPGDGFGIVENGAQAGYVKGMNEHAQLAATAPDTTADITLHAGHVQIAGENVRGRAAEIRTLAEQIATAGTLDATKTPVLAILALAQQSIQGVDVNLDEQVGPIPGEGGVLTAYQHAQLMAGIRLAPDTSVVAAPPVTAAPAEVFAVEIGDNSYTAAKISVPAGATVVWSHSGQRPHTVTADDGSFKSERLEAGASFEQTFTTPGTFAYFCEFHGGAGGQGMAAVVEVVGADAAAPSGATQAVAIADNTFTPADLTVEMGTTVSWSHSGQRPHTVTADDGAFDSGTMQNGASFEQTFSTPGTFAYFCEIHGGAGGQGMAGVIRVIDPTASQSSAPAPTATASAPPPAADAAVAMSDFAFTAQELRVKAGTAVVWSNAGAKPHSARAVDGSFDTGIFQPGETKRVTFSTPGTFAYFCELHGAPDGVNGMVGTVIVE